MIVGQSSRMLDVCVSSIRSVIGSRGCRGLRTRNGSTSFTSASRSSSPSSTACITATDITVFEIDASMKIVSGVARRPCAMFAWPYRAGPRDAVGRDDAGRDAGHARRPHQHADVVVEVRRAARSRGAAPAHRTLPPGGRRRARRRPRPRPVGEERLRPARDDRVRVGRARSARLPTERGRVGTLCRGGPVAERRGLFVLSGSVRDGSDGAWDESGTGAGGADRSEPFERLLLERARPIVAHAEAGEDAVDRRAGARAGRAGPGGRARSARSRGARRRGGAAYLGADRVALLPGVGGAPVRGHRPDARDRRPARRRRPSRCARRRGAFVVVAPALAAMQGLIPTLGAIPPLELVAGRELPPDALADRLVDLGTRAPTWSSIAASSRSAAAWSTCSPATRGARSAWSTGARRSSRCASSRRRRSSPPRRSRACSCPPSAS